MAPAYTSPGGMPDGRSRFDWILYASEHDPGDLCPGGGRCGWGDLCNCAATLDASAILYSAAQEAHNAAARAYNADTRAAYMAAAIRMHRTAAHMNLKRCTDHGPTFTSTDKER